MTTAAASTVTIDAVPTAPVRSGSECNGSAYMCLTNRNVGSEFTNRSELGV